MGIFLQGKSLSFHWAQRSKHVYADPEHRKFLQLSQPDTLVAAQPVPGSLSLIGLAYLIKVITRGPGWPEAGLGKKPGER